METVFLESEELAAKLASALDEARRLREENYALQQQAKPAFKIETETRSDGKVELKAVIPEPKLEYKTLDRLYSKQHEVERRQIDNEIKELFYFLYDQTGKTEENKKFSQKVLNQVIFF